MAASPLFNRITIIGLGLIGSSIARAVHQRGLAETIIGCDSNEVSLAYGRKQGFLHDAVSSPAAVKNSDLVILATPPSSLDAIAAAIATNLKPGAIVMDTCSVKQPAVAAITPHIPPGVYFIPTHPIAGSEHSGIAAGRADLFDHKRIIITPDEPLQDPLKQTVFDFWQAMGAQVEGMPAHLHDMIYAYVSHLPQLLAFATSATLGVQITNDTAYAKFVRLSASNPELWQDIFTLNSSNILKALDRYLDALAHIIRELKNAPADTPTEYDELQSRTVLFPRIAASCLITTTMEAEKQAGFSFARYAGTGFADFTYIASQPPEEDIERISAQYKLVGAILETYTVKLQAFRNALVLNGDAMRILLT